MLLNTAAPPKVHTPPPELVDSLYLVGYGISYFARFSTPRCIEKDSDHHPSSTAVVITAIIMFLKIPASLRQHNLGLLPFRSLSPPLLHVGSSSLLTLILQQIAFRSFITLK
jgi:hypothetical protein